MTTPTAAEPAAPVGRLRDDFTRLRGLVGFIGPALFVLRNTLKSARLQAGEAKANEMIAETQSVLAALAWQSSEAAEQGREP